MRIQKQTNKQTRNIEVIKTGLEKYVMQKVQSWVKSARKDWIKEREQNQLKSEMEAQRTLSIPSTLLTQLSNKNSFGIRQTLWLNWWILQIRRVSFKIGKQSPHKAILKLILWNNCAMLNLPWTFGDQRIVTILLWWR